MFESLSDKLKKTLKNLRGQGKLTPEHVAQTVRQLRSRSSAGKKESTRDEA